MVVVFGSLNVDFVMSVDALPQLGETVIGGDYFLVPGGKGANQACAAARAARGADTRVSMVGQVGSDQWGDFVTSMLREAGVDVTGVSKCDAPTGCASIWVDKAGENAIAVASGANLRARAEQVPDALLGPETWLVLELEVPRPEIWAIVGRAAARGAKVILNVAPASSIPASVLANVDVLVVNAVEASMLSDMIGLNCENHADMAQQLAERHALTCIITLGSDGVIVHGDGHGWVVDALAVSPVDTTGAGDCFVGTLAASLDVGIALPEALRRASVAAGICCTAAGTQSSFPWAEAIDERLRELGPARPV